MLLCRKHIKWTIKAPSVHYSMSVFIFLLFFFFFTNNYDIVVDLEYGKKKVLPKVLSTINLKQKIILFNQLLRFKVRFLILLSFSTTNNKLLKVLHVQSHFSFQ